MHILIFFDDSSKFWHGNNAENDELFHMFIIFLRKFLWWDRNTMQITPQAHRTTLYRNLKISKYKNFLHIEQKI